VRCHHGRAKVMRGRMEARCRVEFTGAELTSGADLATMLEKAATGLVEKVAGGSPQCAGGARAVREARSVVSYA